MRTEKPFLSELGYFGLHFVIATAGMFCFVMVVGFGSHAVLSMATLDLLELPPGFSPGK